MLGKCKNNPNCFSFVCDLYTLTNKRQPLTDAIKTGYWLSFGRILKNVNQSWEPQYCCPTCAIELRSASRGNHPALNFCIPILWNEPQNHDVDCYFSNSTLIKGFHAKNKQQIVYADFPSMAKSVFIHMPKAENSLGVFENKQLNSEGDEQESKRSKKNPNHQRSSSIKRWSSIVGISIKGKEFIEQKCENFLPQSRKRSGIPVAYTPHLKECYEVMKMLLLKINYHVHCWSTCSYFKVIAILLGLQTGCMKYCCFLCYWDSRARDEHYTVKVWSERNSFVPWQRNVAEDPLADNKNVILPPLHIKLRIVKNIVKGIVRNRNAFGYLKLKFPKLSEAKIKEEVFIGPQIRELMQVSEFDECLSSEERKAWLSIKNVIWNFLGNYKSKHYKRYVNEMLRQFHGLNVKMSLKIHFLHSNLDFFPGKLG